MANMRFDPRELQQQIANLYLEYPELVGDEMLKVDMLEGATNIKELLTVILHGLDEAVFMRDGIANRLAELKARHDRKELHIRFLREMILKVMRAADLKKLELVEATLSQRAGQPKLIGEPDVALLPEEFIKVVKTADRTKIREALLRGDFVPECTLSNAEPSLAIYVK
jgi:hypothetical protein